MEIIIIIIIFVVVGGRDSSVGIATPYAMNGPGIESRWARDFPNSSRPTMRPNQPHITDGGVFPDGKAAGALSYQPTSF